jgi:channel protein (hemolysin III family)
MHAERQGNFEFIIGASLFATTMLLLYFLSTLYHALPIGKAKRVFRAFEQAAIFIFIFIFIFIASTYTPFTLGVPAPGAGRFSALFGGLPRSGLHWCYSINFPIRWSLPVFICSWDGSS